METGFHIFLNFIEISICFKKLWFYMDSFIFSFYFLMLNVNQQKCLYPKQEIWDLNDIFLALEFTVLWTSWNKLFSKPTCPVSICLSLNYEGFPDEHKSIKWCICCPFIQGNWFIFLWWSHLSPLIMFC